MARVHEIDRKLLEGLWNQFTRKEVIRDGLEMEAKGPGPVTMPKLPRLWERRGFSFDFDVNLKELSAGQVILETRDGSGTGITLATGERFNLRLTLSGGAASSFWESDHGTGPGTLRINRWQHVTVTVDGGSKLITYTIDGVLNDGGTVRPFGWGRFVPSIDDVNGGTQAALAPKIFGSVKNFRIYSRMLTTSEAVSNYRASQ